jgi:HEAT repeat protein
VFDAADLFDGAEERHSADFNLELVMPDADRRTYPTRNWAAHGGFTREYPRKLEPGGRVATQVDILKHCRPAQPGVYRAQLSYGQIQSNWIEFRVDAPTRAHIDRLVARLDIESLSDKDYTPFMRICYMLGELRDPRAIDALLAVAEIPTRPPRVPKARQMAGHAIYALAKFNAPELAPFWIEKLSEQWDVPAERLGKLGDPRAIEPLRAHALNFGNVAAAKALAELGDDGAIRFLRWDTLRDMDPDDESTWRGSKALELLLSGERLADRLRHEHPGVRAYAVSTASSEGRVDVLTKAFEDADVRVRRRAVRGLASADALDGEPGEHRIRIDALKRALSDADPNIRRAAARGLARHGDDSGEELLRTDLHATDYKTRLAARRALQSRSL